MLKVNTSFNMAYTAISTNNGNKQDDNEAKLVLAIGIERKNPALAFKLFAEVAKHDDSVAQYKCGCLLLRGDGVEKDIARALRYLKTAAKNGSSEAIAELRSCEEIYLNAEANLTGAHANPSLSLFLHDSSALPATHIPDARSSVLAEEGDILPDSPKVPLFSDAHYSFFSTSTHLISGLIGLTPMKEDYDREEFIYAAKRTVLELNKISPPGGIYIKNDDGEWQRIVPGEIDTEMVAAINKIFPPDNASKEEVIHFYQKNPTFEFNVGGVNYEMKPVLVKDYVNNRHYLHFELGHTKLKEPKIMVNFCGNGISQADQLITASHLLYRTGARQIIPSYPNKGINHLLNPELTAATTSIKGSVNPHLLAYNHLANHEKVDLEIYAHSYGNLAAAQFINRIKEVEPERPIFFIGSSTASSLFDVARTFVGSIAAGFADVCNLLNNSDVFKALNRNKITSLIFNNENDPVIRKAAQIQMNDLDPKRFTVVTDYCTSRSHINFIFKISSNRFQNQLYLEKNDDHYRAHH